MVYISYDILWGNEICNKVSAKDRVQDIHLDQIKLKANNTYRKDEKHNNNV